MVIQQYQLSLYNTSAAVVCPHLISRPCALSDSHIGFRWLRAARPPPAPAKAGEECPGVSCHRFRSTTVGIIQINQQDGTGIFQREMGCATNFRAALAVPTALITGAARGIGRALASGYPADGWRVPAVCRDPAALAGLDGIADAARLDVTDDDGIAALAERWRDERIDRQSGAFLDWRGRTIPW